MILRFSLGQVEKIFKGHLRSPSRLDVLCVEPSAWPSGDVFLNHKINEIRPVRPVHSCTKRRLRTVDMGRKERWSGRGDLNPRPPSPELGVHDC